jgi:hypothetical protein
MRPEPKLLLGPVHGREEGVSETGANACSEWTIMTGTPIVSAASRASNGTVYADDCTA